MKRSFYSAPEAFSLSPLLALLPVRGEIGKLEALTASLYARYEKVSGLLKEAESVLGGEIKRRLLAEQGMLKQILDWLVVKPQLGKQ